MITVLAFLHSDTFCIEAPETTLSLICLFFFCEWADTGWSDKANSGKTQHEFGLGEKQLSKRLLKDLVSTCVTRGFDSWILSALLSSHIRNTNTHTHTPVRSSYLYHTSMSQESGVWSFCVCALVAGTENEKGTVYYNAAYGEVVECD